MRGRLRGLHALMINWKISIHDEFCNGDFLHAG